MKIKIFIAQVVVLSSMLFFPADSFAGPETKQFKAKDGTIYALIRGNDDYYINQIYFGEGTCGTPNAIYSYDADRVIVSFAYGAGKDQLLYNAVQSRTLIIPNGLNTGDVSFDDKGSGKIRVNGEEFSARWEFSGDIRNPQKSDFVLLDKSSNLMPFAFQPYEITPHPYDSGAWPAASRSGNANPNFHYWSFGYNVPPGKFPMVRTPTPVDTFIPADQDGYHLRFREAVLFVISPLPFWPSSFCVSFFSVKDGGTKYASSGGTSINIWTPSENLMMMEENRKQLKAK